MPRANRTGVEQVDDPNQIISNNSKSSAGSEASAPAETNMAQTAVRRRRGGRRVVRGTGAAGAPVALKVEERKTPDGEASAPAQSDDQSSDTDSAATAKPRRTRAAHATARSTRSRRRSQAKDDGASAQNRSAAASASDADGESAGSAENAKSAESSEERREPRSPHTRRAAGHADRRSNAGGDRVADLVESLPEGHESHHNPRPMASLLFQEPVLPSSGEDSEPQNRQEESNDESEEPHVIRRMRSRRGLIRENESQDEALDADDEQDGRGARVVTVRRRRKNQNDSHDSDDESESRSRSHSRRLNAQERRAAGEVGQIEDDLEYDNISYMPIDNDEAGGSQTRSRRRRRSRGDREDDRHDERDDNPRSDRSRDDRRDDRDRDRDHDRDDDHERGRRDDRDEDESNERTQVRRRRRRGEDDTDGEGAMITRRRRRRRGQRDSDNGDEPGSRRSRKQQYIDEITDVEGSTRLEAKKQRRRDNRRERSRQDQLVEQDFLARRENVERLMVVREREHHTQISVIEDNVLVEHYVSDIQEVATVGNIYLGRVQNVLPSMEAAFVDIGQARNGVLYAGEVNWDSTRLEGQPRRIELAYRSGDPVLVQVTKDPIGHKGARLTSQVTLAGRFLVLVPSGGMTGVSRKLSERERSRLKSIVSKIAPKDMGVIIRTAAEGASEEALTKDLQNLTRQWERVNAKREEFLHGKRPKLLQGEPDVAIRVVRDIFNDDFSKLIVEGGRVYDRIAEYLDTMAPDLKDKLERWDPAEHEGKDVFDKWQIDSQLRKGMERQVYLPSGGSIVIDRTEAMTTVDVNTGRFIGKGKSLEETVTRCNLEASEEIARQLRLRDIGGMIMIDYVDMVMPANRDLVLRRLVECLARDRTKHQVAEVTSLGLVQMTRKRIGQGLVEAFSEECPTCKGRGFILHDEPTVSSDYADPYAMKGGDPFIKTNKHGHGAPEVQAPKGSSADVKAKLAQIAAAALAANGPEDDGGDE